MKEMGRLLVAGALLVLALAWARRDPAPLVAVPAPTAASKPEKAQVAVPPAPVASVDNEAEPAGITPSGSHHDRLIAALRIPDYDELRKIRDELLAEILPPALPDSENGIFAYLKAFEKMIPASDAESKAFNALREGTATPEQVALLKNLLERNVEAIAMLKSAGGYEACRWPVAYEKGFSAELPHIGSMVKAGLLLHAEDLLQRAGGGDGKEAATALGRLADTMAGDPTLVSQLVRCLGLEKAGVGDPASVRPALHNVLKMEMVSALTFTLDGRDPAWSIRDPKVRVMAEHYVETMREASSIIGQPWYEGHAAMARLEQRVADVDWRADGTRFVLPALSKAMEGAARAEAALGAALDPFSGRPLILRNGVLSSVGPDGVDGSLDDIILRR